MSDFRFQPWPESLAITTLFEFCSWLLINGREVHYKMNYIIGGLVGICLGAFLQRLVIYTAVDSFPPTICDYCHWKKEHQWKRDSKSGFHDK